MKTDKIQLLNTNTGGNYKNIETKTIENKEHKTIESKNNNENILAILRKEIYDKLPLDFINLMNKKYGFFL